MKFFEYGSRAKRLRRNATMGLGLVVIASLMALTLARASGAAATAVPLGSADSFAILAGAGITNTGPTTVGGDIGTFPTTSFTGSASVTQTGTNHAGDSVTQDAKNALVTAYNNAAGQGPTSPIVGLTLGGKTLTRGVYNSGSTIGLTGTVTLDAEGDPDSVFVFQAGSALTTATSSSVALINGARACNVFWQIGSDATIGVGSRFVGTLLVQNSIVLQTGATVNGRVLASVGSVTLDTNTISRPSCAPADSNPDRTLYCQGGTAYNLAIGQDKVAPYAALGLTPAFVDPVTGALTCTASTPPTTTATTPTTTATTTTTANPTTTTGTATPTGPTAKQVAAAKAKRAAAVKAARVAKARQVAAAKSRNIALAKQTPKPKPRPAVRTFGFTG